MPTVFLFDIDGTLLASDGAGRRSLERGIARAFGAERATLDFSFGGWTDRAILRRAFRDRGLELDAAAFDAFLRVYLPILREEVAAARDYRVHAGVRECLAALERRGDVAIGLGTGNVEPGARIKLERVALSERFAFGGFGCDHEDRAELLRIGAERGAARLGRRVEECRVVVVGDTPRDVAAAHAIGAHCVAVATGGASAAELEASGAEHRFANLAEPGAREVLLAL